MKVFKKDVLIAGSCTILAIVMLVWSGFTLGEGKDEESIYPNQELAQCTYIAGAMSAIQQDRLDSGYSMEDFILAVRLMYKEGEGTDILVSMVVEVYQSVPDTITPDAVFDSAFDYCMMLQEQAKEEVQEYTM